MFDYNKFSFNQYKTMFFEFYKTQDASTLPFEIFKVTELNPGEKILRVSTQNNVIVLRHDSFHVSKHDSIGNYDTFYSSDPISESVGTPYIGYVKRKSQGISYKEFNVSNKNFTRIKKSECRVNSPDKSYNIVIKKHKKKTEYSLRINSDEKKNWNTSIEINEEYDSRGKVKFSYCSVYDSGKSYSVRIDRSPSNTKKNKLICTSEYKQIQVPEYNAPDASILNLYNRHLMWDIDLNSDEKVFNTINIVREKLVHNLNYIIKKGNNHYFLTNMLKNIEFEKKK